MFYNELHKNRYLKNCRFEETTISVIKMWFNTTEPIESMLNKDLYNFSRADVMKLFKSFNSTSKRTLTTVSFFFSDYYQWSLKEGAVSTKDNPDPYEVNMIKSLINNIITIDMIEDKYFKKSDVLCWLKTLKDPTLRFQLYAVYCGAYGKEYGDLTNLKLIDINKSDKTVKLQSGIKINVDDLFIQLAEEADKQTEFTPNGTNIDDKWHRYVFDKSNYIIKSCRTGKVNEPVKRLVVNMRFNIIKKQCQNRFLTGNTIYKNGLINYIRESFEKENVSLVNAIFQKSNDKEYTHSLKLDKVIQEFGSQINGRALRGDLEDVIELLI
jgi:hypothetical protein